MRRFGFDRRIDCTFGVFLKNNNIDQLLELSGSLEVGGLKIVSVTERVIVDPNGVFERINIFECL